MTLREKAVYEFGPFHLDSGLRLLHREGEFIPLAPKAFDTLLALLEKAGEVVEKNALLKEIWPDTFVEEGSLAQNISILRKVLGEAPNGQPYIQTIPKRGYRFVTSRLRQSSSAGSQRMRDAEDAFPALNRDELIPSIAVLPFSNMSDNKEYEYFSDGLTEEIIFALGKIPGLKVTGRTSAFASRRKEQDIKKIAKTLRVGTILQGSVRYSGNRIRVAAQLINAADGYHLWSDRYDRELTEVFAIQDEIAAAIVSALRVKLPNRSAATLRPQPNLPAYEALLRGRHQYFKNTPDAVTRAREYFEQAIALDPKYAEPHAGLGLCYFFQWVYGVRPASEIMSRVRSEAQKALDLFASEPGALALLGVVAAAYDYAWDDAEEYFQRAITARPVPPEVRVRYALYGLLPHGRFQEAISEIEQGIVNDPLSILLRAYLSFILSAAGTYDRAIAEARKTLEVDESFWATHSMIAHGYAFQGKYVNALEWAENAHRLAPWDSNAAGFLAGLLSRIGNEKRAKEILAKPMPVETGMMFFHLLRSEIDSAMEWYQKGIEQHAPFAVVLATHNFTKPLRESRRWPALAKMMNLPGHAR